FHLFRSSIGSIRRAGQLSRARNIRPAQSAQPGTGARPGVGLRVVRVGAGGAAARGRGAAWSAGAGPGEAVAGGLRAAAGVGGEGGVGVARQGGVGGELGRGGPAEQMAGAGAARVVVQPDFSVVVIGLNPTASAELAPFSERAGSRSGPGILQLRITRAGVINAVASGLSGEEIVERLQRHSSVPVPANVLHEVREWAGWVRSLEATPLTVLRCPDAATADRVITVLGRRAERLAETLVAMPQGTLGLNERNRLQAHGILLHLSRPGESPSSPKKRGH